MSAKPTAKEQDWYKVLVERLDRVIDAIKPGNTTADAAQHFPPASKWGYQEEAELLTLEIGQQPRRLIRHRPHLGLGRFGKAGNHMRVDRIGLGALPERLGVSPHLGRIDHDHRQTRARQGGHGDRLVTAGRLECHDPDASKPLAQLAKSSRVPADGPRFSARQDMNVQPILRHIDACNGGLPHGTPSLLKRARKAALTTVRVHRNDGEATVLRNGLTRPRVRRSPLRHRARQSTPARPR